MTHVGQYRSFSNVVSIREHDGTITAENCLLYIATKDPRSSCHEFWISFHRPSSQHRQKGNFCWWQSGQSPTFTRPPLFRPSLPCSPSLSRLSDGETGHIHLIQEAPSVSGECVCAPSDWYRPSFSLWDMKANRSFKLCLNLRLVVHSLCVLFSSVAKTITCADTGNLNPACNTPREG